MPSTHTIGRLSKRKGGGLVKVYDFSQKARKYYLDQGEDPKDVNRHYLGIIIVSSPANDTDPYVAASRTVMRVGSQDQVEYDIDRIEVIK